ncbi:MAG: electron transporter RnfG, partial [Gammaproteobacteria bacterium]|nr:electron transporter RnfG [Gammaproteobacteria bacterium]
MRASHSVLVAGALLGLFSVSAAGLDRLAAIVRTEHLTNDVAQDRIEVSDRERLGSDRTVVYRARQDGRPAGVVLTPVVPDGYAGPIRLLVAVLPDGTLGGVRVLSHKE